MPPDPIIGPYNLTKFRFNTIILTSYANQEKIDYFDLFRLEFNLESLRRCIKKVKPGSVVDFGGSWASNCLAIVVVGASCVC